MLLQQAGTTTEKQTVAQIGFWRLGGTLSSLFLGFIVTVVIARVLGTAGFGVYTFALWLATAAIPVVGVGTSTLASRHLAEIQTSQSSRQAAGVFFFVWKRQVRTIVLYCLGYLFLVFPLALLFGNLLSMQQLLLAGLSVPPLLLSGVAGVTLRRLRRFDLLTSISVFGALAMLLCIILAIPVRGNQIEVFLVISALAGMLTLTIALLCIVRLLPLNEAQQPGPLLKDRLTRGINNSVLLFVLDIIVWQRGSLLLLTHVSSSDLGFYALSALISMRVMEFSPFVYSTVVLPLSLRFLPGQHYTNAVDAYIKTSRSMMVLSILFCGIAILLCPYIITIFFGVAYLSVVMPLRILLCAAAFGSVATVSLTHLASSERKKAQIILGTGAALLNVGLALPFISLWGITGAALATAIAQVVSAMGSILICRRLMIG